MKRSRIENMRGPAIEKGKHQHQWDWPGDCAEVAIQEIVAAGNARSLTRLDKGTSLGWTVPLRSGGQLGRDSWACRAPGIKVLVWAASWGTISRRWRGLGY